MNKESFFLKIYLFQVLLICLSFANLDLLYSMELSEEELKEYLAKIEKQKIELRKKEQTEETRQRLRSLGEDESSILKYEEFLKEQEKISKEQATKEALYRSFNEKDYRMAVESVARGQLLISYKPEVLEISNPNLVWDRNHEYILMTSWVPEFAVNKFICPQFKQSNRKFKTSPMLSAGLTWVTLYPKVKEFITKYIKGSPDKAELAQIEKLRRKLPSDNMVPIQERLSQFLGLPKPLAEEKRYLINYWIKPKDLVRPCDLESEMCATQELIEKSPHKEITKEKGYQEEYSTWFKEKLEYEPWRPMYVYPWTHKGYTFDWGPGSEINNHKGFDEYIVKPNSTLIIESISIPEEYITNKIESTVIDNLPAGDC